MLFSQKVRLLKQTIESQSSEKKSPVDTGFLALLNMLETVTESLEEDDRNALKEISDIISSVLMKHNFQEVNRNFAFDQMHLMVHFSKKDESADMFKMLVELQESLSEADFDDSAVAIDIDFMNRDIEVKILE